MDEHLATITSPRSGATIQRKRSLADKAYLQELSKFVGLKVPDTANPRSEHPRMSLQNHLERRKLAQVNHETRFNRIMDGFKNLDTFVDVKSLVRELSRFEQGSQDAVVNVPEHAVSNEPRCSERLLAESSESSPYLKIIERANRRIASNQSHFPEKDVFQLSNLVDELSKFSRYQNQCLLDETYPTDMFQVALMNKFAEEDEACRRVLTIPDCSPQSSVRKLPVFEDHSVKFANINSEYYEKYKQKAEDIQAKLHHMLEAMHMAKWRDRQKHPQHSTSPLREKPLLDSKYRIHAPRKYFRFKEIEASQKQFKLKNRQPLVGPHTRDAPQQTTAGCRVSQFKMRHQAEKNLLNRCPRGSAPLLNRSQLQSKTFTQMKQLHKNYSFKKPLIKDTILRKIVDFIDGVEKQQFSFRRHNEQLTGHIARLQANKQIDFDRFLQQRVDVNLEDMQNFCQRNHS